MHPFLDVNKLTDEEIIDRLGKAYTYMNSQITLGHNPTVFSIKEIIQSLEDERHKRLQNITREEFNKKYPNDTKPINLGRIDE